MTCCPHRSLLLSCCYILHLFVCLFVFFVKHCPCLSVTHILFHTGVWRISRSTQPIALMRMFVAELYEQRRMRWYFQPLERLFRGGALRCFAMRTHPSCRGEVPTFPTATKAETQDSYYQCPSKSFQGIFPMCRSYLGSHHRHKMIVVVVVVLLAGVHAQTFCTTDLYQMLHCKCLVSSLFKLSK